MAPRTRRYRAKVKVLWVSSLPPYPFSHILEPTLTSPALFIITPEVHGRVSGSVSLYKLLPSQWCESTQGSYCCRYFACVAMERQGSAASTTAILNGANASPTAGTWSAPVAGLDSTVIPIREEFRCRRLWFFYHDIRAFTTSVSESHYMHLYLLMPLVNYVMS